MSAFASETHEPVIVAPMHEPSALYRLLVPRDFRLRATQIGPARRVIGRPEPLGLFLRDTEGEGPGLAVTMTRLPLAIAVDRFMRLLAERQGSTVAFVRARPLECGDRIELLATRGARTLHQLGVLDNGRLFQIHATARSREWPEHRERLWHSLTSFTLAAPGPAQCEPHVTAAHGPLAFDHPATWTVLAKRTDPLHSGNHAIDLALFDEPEPTLPRALLRVKTEPHAGRPDVTRLLATVDRELRSARYAPARTKHPRVPDPAFAIPPEGWLGTFECEAALGVSLLDLRYGFAWRDGVAVSVVGLAAPPRLATTPWLRMHAAFELAAQTARILNPSP